MVKDISQINIHMYVLHFHTFPLILALSTDLLTYKISINFFMSPFNFKSKLIDEKEA